MHNRVSNVPFVWTDEAVKVLTALWADGLTASQIARKIDCGISRNAVVGKVHRLKLPPREVNGSAADKVARAARKGRATRSRNDPKPQAIVASVEARRKAPAIIPYDVPDTEGTDVTYLVTRDEYRLREHCSYGFGDPKTPDFRFCGKPLHTGHWCAEHAAVVYPGGRP